MRLYISTLSKRFVHSATYTAPLDGFTFKRHDVEPIELHFLDENGLVEIPAKFIGKALFVAGSYDEFNGKYLPTGSSENGKPVWEKAGIKIKYVSENTYAVSAAIVTNAPTYFLNGKYLPDTILNGKTCYKNTATQNRFEWKPAETVMGDGVLLTGESTFAGLYSLDGSANSKPRFTQPGVAEISWKPQWQAISNDDLTISNMQADAVNFDGSYLRAPTPFNSRPRYYKPRPTDQTSILSSIQFESAYSLQTEDAQGNSDNLNFITTTSGHFSVNLNGRFIKTSGNNVPGIGSSVDKWTLGNNDAYIVSRSAGTYTNPYRLNLPNIGSTSSGSSLAGNSWFLDDTLHNGQPQWHFGTSPSTSACLLRFDDPTNFKWRFIQTGTNTPMAELTVTDANKNPIGKVGWVKLNNSNFVETALNDTGGLKYDNWIIEQDHWVLMTTKPQSAGLVIDPFGQNPLAYVNRQSTTFPASFAGNAVSLSWRSYADGSYAWGTSKITDQIPNRWVARKAGISSQPSADELNGWGGDIEFYTDDNKTNVWETSAWRRSASQTVGASIQRQTITYPARWLLHAENNSASIYFQAIVAADVPYGPWLDGNGESFEDQWIADQTGQAAGSPALSSFRQSTNFPPRWSLANDTHYSATNSLSPWQALNWKNTDGTPSSIGVSQDQATTPPHWGLINPDDEEQYAAFNNSGSPVGATWQDSTNNNPPDSISIVDHYAPIEGKLAIKKNLLFDGPILAESSPWTENPETKSYSFTFNLNTAEIDAEFHAEQESIDGMIELTWSSTGSVTSSFTLPVKIYNDVIRGLEGPPTPQRSSLLAEMTGLAIVFGN